MNAALRLNTAALVLLLSACERQGPAAIEAETDVPLKTLEAAVPMTGAYRESAVTPDIQAVAEFAVREHSQNTETPITLVEINYSEQQVVAGSNYRLQLAVEQEGSTRRVSAVVFEDPYSKLKLVSWDEIP